MKLFHYYQPNDKDLKDRFGDCQIRALSKALDCTWLEAFDKAIAVCREEQVGLIFDCPIPIRTRMLDKLGFDYVGITNKKGSRRPTVREFARTHPSGTYICSVSHHEVAVVDGQYWDTWDCGNKSMYGYFVKR